MMNSEIYEAITQLKSKAVAFPRKESQAYLLRLDVESQQVLLDICSKTGLDARAVLLLGLQWLGSCLDNERDGLQ